MSLPAGIETMGPVISVDVAALVPAVADAAGADADEDVHNEEHDELELHASGSTIHAIRAPAQKSFTRQRSDRTGRSSRSRTIRSDVSRPLSRFCCLVRMSRV